MAEEPYVPTAEELKGNGYGYCYSDPVVVPPPDPVPVSPPVEEKSSPTIISPGYRFRRGTGSPFDVVPNPVFGTNSGIPCQWCHYCQMSVETRSSHHNQNQVFGMKQWCRRCGNVTASAVYYHVASLDEPATPLLRKAQDWMHQPEAKG